MDETLTTNISLHYGGVLAYRDVHGHEPRMSRDFCECVKVHDRLSKRQPLAPLRGWPAPSSSSHGGGSDMTPLEKAQQALRHNDQFNGDKFDREALYIDGPDALYELPHAEGQFTLGGFRALVNEFEELKHRMDGLEK